MVFKTVGIAMSVVNKGMDIKQVQAYLMSIQGLTKAERTRIYQMLGLITTTNGQTVANLGATASLKTMVSAIWKVTAAWAASPLGMATIAAASIFAIVKLVDLFTVSLEESREKLAELKEEYNENQSELSTLNDELQTTVDRIRELQGKDSLTFTEAEELENLMRQNTELERQIALLETIQRQKTGELNKAFVETMEKDLRSNNEYSITSRYASRNYSPQFGIVNAVSVGRGPEATTMSEQDLLYSAIMRRNEIYNELQKASYEDRERLQKDLDDIEEYLISKSRELAEASEGISYISNPTTEDDKKVNEWLDFINDFNDRMMIALGQSGAKENALSRLAFGRFSEATTELKDLGRQGQVTAEHLSDERYDDFIQTCIDFGIVADDGKDSLKFLASFFNTVAESAGNAGENIGQSGSELNGLSDSITSLKSAYDLLDKAMKEMDNGGLTVDTIKEIAGQVDNLTDYLYIENGAIKLNTEAWKEYADSKISSDISGIQSTIGILQNDNAKLEAQKKEYEDNRKLGNDGNIWTNLIAEIDKAISENNEKIAENQELLDIYNTLYADITGACDTASRSFADSLAKINALNTGLSELSKIYSDISDGGDFDWSSLLDNDTFTNAFGGLGDAYTEFVEIIANSTNDIESCQGAFDNLVSAYLRDSEALRGVTDTTRDATVAMLEQMGIANAAAIVDAQLAYNKERLTYTTGEYADMTYEEILAQYNAVEAGSVAQQVLAELALAKIFANENTIQTASDIDQIIALANAANATTQSIANLTKAKALFARADAKYAESETARQNGGNNGDWQKLYAQARSLRQQAEDLLNNPLEYNQISAEGFKSSSVSSSSGSKGSGSSSQSETESWFEKQLAEHQHLVAMEQETESEYLSWLSNAYPQAYQEGILELKDFYKYQEEVFTKLREIFKDSLNDIEHEISMRENYDGETKKIIELYEGLIEKVEKEISAARSRGLTDENDYIQELQKKWQDYTKSIKDLRDEITDSAKDALDELVDYRIDMLKQEIEDEKDALDERLDNLKEFYDKQKELLQDQRDEETYLKDQTDKRKTVTDLQAELAMLENDDSAWAQKRKLDLKEEIATAQDDLNKFEKDHALELALDALDKAYDDQEAQIDAEMDALEERLNDPEALYNKALEDIRKNSENQLYYQMLMYNRQFGDGNDATVNKLWESAFGAFTEYEKLFGELYNGVRLENETGVKNEGGWNNESISGTNPNNRPSTSSSAGSTATETSKSYPYGKASETSGNIGTGATGTKVKAIQYALNELGFGNSGTADCDGIFGSGTQEAVKAFQRATGIRSDGIVGNDTRAKFKAQGYAVGTRNATAGIHAIDELGTEYIFESPRDGTRYRMFHGGEKVLNAEATDFLYNFATSGGSFLSKMIANLFGLTNFGSISKPIQAIEVNAGDIIVQGSCDNKTVSEIRRAQRDELGFFLKELNKLNR